MALTGDALPDWLLACDIVASIEAASRLGDRKWRALLDAHYAILRAELDRFGGREIDTAGDGLFAAFTGLPGAGSTRAAALPQGAVLARHGYGALLLDGRGHGRSGGHTMDFGWWGGPDIAAALSFLDHQPGVRPGKIALLGESMGGEQALAAMGTDPRIRAAVGEGVTGQQLADHGWMMHGITGVLDTGMESVQYTAAGLISGAPRPMSIPDAIRAAAPRPVLIIAGGAVAAEPAAARWFRAASPATVYTWVVPHAGHTAGLATAPRAWADHVISFLNTALHPATPASPGTGSNS
jgi:class 3 adenylate cyclase